MEHDAAGDRPRRRRRVAAQRRSNPVVVWSIAVGAVVVIGLTAMLAVHFLKSRPGDPRLIGTWKSDIEATLAETRKSREVTDQQEAGFRKLFGKAKVTYTITTMTTEWEDIVDSKPYQVVRKDKDSVVIKLRSQMTEQDEEVRLRFDGNDTYWFEMPKLNFGECFRRVK